MVYLLGYINVSFNWGLWYGSVLSLIGRRTREKVDSNVLWTRPPDLCRIVESTGKTRQWEARTICHAQNRTLIFIAVKVIPLCVVYNNIALVSKPATWKGWNGCYWYINISVSIVITAELVAQLLQCILASQCTYRPKGVHAEVVDLHGESNRSSGFLDRYTEMPDIHIAALLWMILYSDDPDYHLDACPKLDHITTPEDELRFPQAAEIKASVWNCALWYRCSSHCRMTVSWDPEIHVASVVSNHLIAGILQTVGGVNLLRKDHCSQGRSCIMNGSDSRRGS